MTYLLFVAVSLIFYFRFRPSIDGGLPTALLSLVSAWTFFCGAAVVAHWIAVRATNGYFFTASVLLGAAMLIRRPTWGTSNDVRVSIWAAAPLVVGLVAVLYFHNNFGRDIKYISSDPTGHFDMAWTYARNRLMLLDQQSHVFPYDRYPPLFYINAGLLFGDVSQVLPAELIREYNLINFGILTVFALLVLCVCTRIANGRQWLACLFTFAIVAGHPLDVYFSGFSSQLVALVFIVAIVVSMTHASGRQPLLLQNVLLLGLYFIYFYYIPFVLFAIFLHRMRNSEGKSFLRTVVGFVKAYLPFFIGSLSMLAAFAASAKVISVNGAMFTDLYLSFLIFTPVVAWMFWCRKYSEVEYFLVSALAFFVSLLVLRVAGIASVYYVFKIYAVLYIFMGFCTLRCFVTVDVKKIVAAYLMIGVPLLLISDRLYSETVTSRNYFVMKSNYNFMTKKPIFDAAQMDLISKLNAMPGSHENVCMASEVQLQLMWFVELTDGAYFRGKGDSHFLWSKDKSWSDINRDPECKLPGYDYVIELSCAADEKRAAVSNSGGCIRKGEN